MIARMTALTAAAALLAACPSSSAPVQPDGEPAQQPAPAQVDPAEEPGSSHGPAPTKPAMIVSTHDDGPADPDAAAAANNAFAVALYGRLAEGEGNRFFAPVSASTALAMTAAGAAGQTKAEMAAVLHLPAKGAQASFGALGKALTADRGEATEITVANRLWGQEGEGFLDGFLATTKTHYGAGLERLNFAASEAARATINGWVAAQTHDKIPDLIPPGVIDANTRLVLTNAIYFLGKWAEAFDADNTRPAPFHLASGGEVKAQLMRRRGDYGFYEDGDVQVLRMRYKDADMSMVVVLPRAKGGLPAVEASLGDKLASWIENSQRRVKVDVLFPRFELRAKAQLSQALKALGMKDAFGPAADFSAMNGKKDLYISAVIHEAYVKVDEEGTEAAGATAVVMARKSASRPVRIPEFKADHPFLFSIVDDRTGAVLFMGRIADPTASK